MPLPRRRLRRLLNNRAALGGLLIFAASLIGAQPAYAAAKSGDWFSFVVALLFVLWVGWFAFISGEAEPTPPSETGKFAPLQVEDHPRLWPRENSLRSLTDQISRYGRARPVYIVGPSGVGKSVLARRFLPEDDRFVVHLWAENRYANPDQVLDELSRLEEADDRCTVAVLDQFESFSTQWGSEFGQDDHLNQTLRSLIDRGIAPVIVCRSDRMYDLRLLGDLAPDFAEIVELPSLSEEMVGDPATLRGISKQFEDIVDVSGDGRTVEQWLSDVLDTQSAIRPGLTTLELEMAAAALVQGNDHLPVEAAKLDELAQRDLCMLFLKHQLTGLRRENVALKLLYALASRDPCLEPLRQSELFGAVFENAEDCKEALTELRKRKLIKAPYRLSHDALKELCEQYCAVQLDGWETRMIRSRLARPRQQPLRDHDSTLRLRRAGRIFLVITAAIGLARTALPDWTLWTLFSSKGQQLSTVSNDPVRWHEHIDKLFALVTLVFLAWAHYVVRLTSETFLRVRSRMMTFLGGSAWALVIAGMLFGAFFVQFWMLSVAGIGYWLAATFYWVSRGASPSVREHLLTYSFPTAMFMTAAAVGGLAVYFWAFAADDPADRFQISSLLAGVALLAICVVLTKLHTSTTFTSRIRGMLVTDYRGDAHVM